MTTPSHADLLREYLEQLSQPGSESRLPAWKDWLKLRVGGAVAIGAALALVGCDESDNADGNQGGAAGMSQVSPASGGALNYTSVVAVYAAPMSGGSSSTTIKDSGTGGVFDVTSPIAEYMAPMPTGGASAMALYAAPMTGGTSAVSKYAVPMTGGTTGSTKATTTLPGLRYAAPMGGNKGSGSATRTDPVVSTGGSDMAALYMVVMDK